MIPKLVNKLKLLRILFHSSDGKRPAGADHKGLAAVFQRLDLIQRPVVHGWPVFNGFYKGWIMAVAQFGKPGSLCFFPVTPVAGKDNNIPWVSKLHKGFYRDAVRTAAV